MIPILVKDTTGFNVSPFFRIRRNELGQLTDWSKDVQSLTIKEKEGHFKNKRR